MSKGLMVLQTGEILINATKNILLQDLHYIYKEITGSILLDKHIAEVKLSNERGAHYQRLGFNKHEIKYGKTMIYNKMFLNINEIIGYTTSKEILREKYFNGEITRLNLITQVALHEFSHMIQCLAGKRKRGKMHCAFFYHVLNWLHENNYKEKVENYIKSAAKEKKLILENEKINISENNIKKIKKINEEIAFKVGGNLVKAKIVKINKKTYTVHVIKNKKILIYRVPFVLDIL